MGLYALKHNLITSIICSFISTDGNLNSGTFLEKQSWIHEQEGFFFFRI